MHYFIGVISKIPKINENLAKQLEFRKDAIQCSIDYFDSAHISNEKLLFEFIEDKHILLVDPGLISSAYDRSHQFTSMLKLKWIQSTWAGVNTLFQSSYTERPKFLLTKMAGFGESMAEYCVGHIISLERSFVQYYIQQQHHKWNAIPYRKLSSLTVGILGFGTIGVEVAKACRAFGVSVLSCTRCPLSADIAHIPQQQFVMEDFDEFVSKLDYLICILPSTKETNHLLSGDKLKNCNPSCVLINVGRGNIIDEKSLLNALDQGWIKGAILDVFEKEPIAEDSALWDKPNVIITPHVSALSLAEDVAKVFIGNLELFCEGKPLQYQVDFEKQY